MLAFRLKFCLGEVALAPDAALFAPPVAGGCTALIFRARVLPGPHAARIFGYASEQEVILCQAVPLDTLKEDHSLIPFHPRTGSLGPFFNREIRELHAVQFKRILPDREVGNNIRTMLGLEHKGIFTGSACQNITLFSALQPVASTTPNKPVPCVTTGQEIIPVITFKVIPARIAAQGILAIGTTEPVPAIGAREFLCSTFRRIPPVYDIEPVSGVRGFLCGNPWFSLCGFLSLRLHCGFRRGFYFRLWSRLYRNFNNRLWCRCRGGFRA